MEGAQPIGIVDHHQQIRYRKLNDRPGLDEVSDQFLDRGAVRALVHDHL